MKKIVDYEIVSFYGVDSVVKHVKEGILIGWQPFGPVHMDSFVDDSGKLFTLYAQSMVKYAEND